MGRLKAWSETWECDAQLGSSTALGPVLPSSVGLDQPRVNLLLM